MILYADPDIGILFLNPVAVPFNITTFLSWANWREDIRVTDRWATSIFFSDNNTETRKQLRDRPLREVDYSTLFVSDVPAGQAWGFVQSMARGRKYLPLVMDVSVLIDGEATADTMALNDILSLSPPFGPSNVPSTNFQGATTTIGAMALNDILSLSPPFGSSNVRFTVIKCDTTLRNFQEGYYAVLVHTNLFRSIDICYSAEDTQYYPVKIVTVEDDQLMVEGELPEQFYAGDVIFPAILCEVSLDGLDVTIFNPTTGEIKVQASEVYNSLTLPPANPDYSPTLYHGIPYVPFDINWIEFPKFNISNPGSAMPTGRYQIVEYPTANTLANLSFLTSATSREACWELLGKLNYLKGRYTAFWLISPLDILTVGIFQAPTYIEVLCDCGDENIVMIHGLYIENDNGECDFLTGSMSEVAGRWRFTYNETTTVTDVTRVKQAFIIRSRKDDFEHSWYSTSVMDIKLDLVEITEAYS